MYNVDTNGIFAERSSLIRCYLTPKRLGKHLFNIFLYISEENLAANVENIKFAKQTVTSLCSSKTAKH